MKNVRVTKEEITKVASLSRIDLTDDELKRYTEQLGDILAYMEQVKDIAGKSAAINVVTPHHGLVNTFRDDKVVPSEVSVEKLLSNVPRRHENLIGVPRILEGRDG